MYMQDSFYQIFYLTTSSNSISFLRFLRVLGCPHAYAVVVGITVVVTVVSAEEVLSVAVVVSVAVALVMSPDVVVSPAVEVELAASVDEVTLSVDDATLSVDDAALSVEVAAEDEVTLPEAVAVEEPEAEDVVLATIGPVGVTVTAEAAAAVADDDRPTSTHGARAARTARA